MSNYIKRNTPNPYKDETIIRTTIDGDKNMLRITDMFGKQVFVKSLKSGYNEVVFSGTRVTAGIYYYSIISNGHMVKTKWMCIIK